MSQDVENDEEYKPFETAEAEDALIDTAQNSRSFLIFMGLFILTILLCILLYIPLNDFSKLFLLIALLATVLVAATRLQPLPPPPQIEQTYRPVVEEHTQAEADTQSTFEQLVQEALTTIPDEFHTQMEHVIVFVEPEPDQETLRQTGLGEEGTLLGVYHGIPLTAWGHNQTILPERITIYQQTIERICGGDPDRIRAQVRATVLHEVAHHFGIDHDDMPIWIK